MNAALTIQLVDWRASRDELLALRHTVFITEQQVPAELEEDEHDPEANHFMVRLDGQLIGTGRLTGGGQIGRVAILADFRQRGYGQALMETIQTKAHQLGFKRVFLHAQLSALVFYQRLGFSAFGEVFDDAGIAHQAMDKQLLQEAP